MRFDVESNHAKICWTRNALGYINHDGEVCQYADENKQITFTFGELCTDEARKKKSSGFSICPPLFFRIEGWIDLSFRWITYRLILTLECCDD